MDDGQVSAIHDWQRLADSGCQLSWHTMLYLSYVEQHQMEQHFLYYLLILIMLSFK